MDHREFSESIKMNRRSRHDTVYCNESQARTLKQAAGAPGVIRPNKIDDLTIHGVHVEVLPISAPILCQKGDVFPLAKEYKNDDTEPFEV